MSPPDSPARPPPASRWRAWLRLLRAPNLLTAPGDPLAGAALALADAGAAGPPPWTAAAAALAFYAGGLLDNDVCGLDEDRRTRPERPLCRGDVSVRAAAAARTALFAAGAAAAVAAGRGPAAVAAVLLSLILLYHRLLARHAMAGPAALGLCRAASLWLGVAAAGGRAGGHVWTATVMWAVYIAGVSALARGETAVSGRPGRIGGALGMLPLMQAAAVLYGQQNWSAPMATALAAAFVAAAALRRRIPAS